MPAQGRHRAADMTGMSSEVAADRTGRPLGAAGVLAVMLILAGATVMGIEDFLVARPNVAVVVMALVPLLGGVLVAKAAAAPPPPNR